MSTINYGLMNGGFGIFAPYRHFSQIPRAVIPKNDACDGEGRRKSTSFLSFNKNWKQTKRLTHKKPLEVGGRTSTKSIKAVKKDDILALKDSPIEDGKIEVNLVENESQLPKTKAKKKPTPKVKKSQEKSAVASEEPPPPPPPQPQASSKKSFSVKEVKVIQK